MSIYYTPIGYFSDEQITPAVGKCVMVENNERGMQWPQYWQCLLPETWEKADFRIPTGYENPKGTPPGRGLVESLACKVRVTGRKVRYNGYCDEIRIEITIVGDDEPDTILHGWMRVERS